MSWTSQPSLRRLGIGPVTTRLGLHRHDGRDHQDHEDDRDPADEIADDPGDDEHVIAGRFEFELVEASLVDEH